MKLTNKKLIFKWMGVFLIVLVSFLVILNFNEGIRSVWEKASTHIFEPEFPQEYIPLYQEAANQYGIPWTLLAAHHRVETKFSTMDPLLSSKGAEGHMQFMPCTFVGWYHPTCTGQGKGEIKKNEKTNPAVIRKYGGYGTDGDGDGIADPYNLQDALYSAANYLSDSGAANGELKRAIFNYNQSEEYVEKVLLYFNKYEDEFRKD